MNSSIDSTRQAQLRSWAERLRSGQREIADWTGGRLAVSAVPGAGKSTGMAIAAVITIARQGLQANGLQTNAQLVLVTFTRSAAANLKSKIRERLKLLDLPMGGFLATTLHGLAWSIARSYPELSGITDDTMLTTVSQNHRLLRGTVEQWIAENSQLYERLILGVQFDGEETERLRRQSVLRTEVLPALTMIVVQEAKKSGLVPDDLARAGRASGDDYSVLTMAAGLYAEYQQQLRSRSWIDYDEMILGALRVLQNSAACLVWRSQVFAVFEDEAQDSSPLQTRLLEILATRSETLGDVQRDVQNLIRVGDPNQAINSTFTPADPVFFRSFCTQCQTEGNLAQMTQAGRSSRVILDAANYLLNWANATQGKAGKELPFRSQMIEPVSEDDPQPDANPEPVGLGFEIARPKDTYESVVKIGTRITALMAMDPDRRAAVLVRTNDQGRFVASELRRLFPNTPDRPGLDVFEVGEEERRSPIPAEMLALLKFCDRPHSPDLLKAALIILMTHKRIPTQNLNVIVTAPEQFLYPSPIDPELSHEAQQASRVCRSLLKSRIELPLYQLISFFAYTLNYDQAELATTDKLSERLSQQIKENSLGELIAILSEVVISEQFEPVMAESNENRYMRSGQVTIITMHKAKGLDWDYVFIPFLHEAMIPGKLYVPGPAKFLGPFTLPEVARAQIRAIVHGKPLPSLPSAWNRSEELKQAEEYRLLYVGMTRAKRLLWMSAAKRGPFTWSKPEQLDDRTPCPAIPALIKQFPNHVVR